MLQLHQTLVDAGIPAAGTGSARAFLHSLCQRLSIRSSSPASLVGDFFALLTYLLAKSPALTCSWLTDYLAATATLTSSDPEEAVILQPETVLTWCQESTSVLQQRLGLFLQNGPSSPVLELRRTAQALLSVATAVQATSTSRRWATVALNYHAMHP